MIHAAFCYRCYEDALPTVFPQERAQAEKYKPKLTDKKSFLHIHDIAMLCEFTPYRIPSNASIIYDCSQLTTVMLNAHDRLALSCYMQKLLIHETMISQNPSGEASPTI